MAYLDNDGLLYFWQSIKTKFATKEELDSKAAVGHKHVIADVDGLQAALDAHGVKLVTTVTDGNLEISIA